MERHPPWHLCPPECHECISSNQLQGKHSSNCAVRDLICHHKQQPKQHGFPLHCSSTTKTFDGRGCHIVRWQTANWVSAHPQHPHSHQTPWWPSVQCVTSHATKPNQKTTITDTPVSSVYLPQQSARGAFHGTDRSNPLCTRLAWDTLEVHSSWF